MNTINSNNNETIYCFIDHQNLDFTIRKCGWKLNYKKLYHYLKKEYKCKKIFLFIGYIEKYKSFYTLLETFGYDVVFKPTIIQHKSIKGNCDAELVLHAMIEYKNYSKAIIITGDGDFYCLIKYLNKNNKLLFIGIPDKNKYSRLLKKFKDHCFFFNTLRNQLQRTSSSITIYTLKERKKDLIDI